MAEWAQEVLALARRWFIMLRRERLSLIFSLVQPAIWLVFFGLGMGRAIDARAIGAADYLSFVLPGIIAFPVVGNGVSDAMPGWMAAIARLNPLSYAIGAMRILVLDGWTTELPVTLGVLAASAAALLACGTYEFRRHTGGRVG